MLSSDLIRRSGLLAVLGGVLWTATWILVAFTMGGTRDVLGFSERGWRTLLLNPAMLLFMVGVVGFHVKQAARSGSLGRTGFAVCLLGLGTMLLGNIVEFWVSELFFGTQVPGWQVMGVGFLILPIGLLLLGIGTLKAGVFSGWRRAVPFTFGVVLALLILSGVAWMFLSSSRSQVGFFRAAVLCVAAGWCVLGAALWSDGNRGASHSGQGPGDSGARR
jgi:hypothetical protein